MDRKKVRVTSGVESFLEGRMPLIPAKFPIGGQGYSTSKGLGTSLKDSRPCRCQPGCHAVCGRIPYLGRYGLCTELAAE